MLSQAMRNLIIAAALSSLAFAFPSFALPSQGHTQSPFFYKGFDLSSLKILEEGPPPAIYKDTARHNETRPAEDILGDGGMNTVRLR